MVKEKRLDLQHNPTQLLQRDEELRRFIYAQEDPQVEEDDYSDYDDEEARKTEDEDDGEVQIIDCKKVDNDYDDFLLLDPVHQSVCLCGNFTRNRKGDG